MLADAFLPFVHGPGDVGGEPLPPRVGELGDALGPRPLRLRDEALHHRPDPGVQDAGHVLAAFQVPRIDGGLDDLGRVQAGVLGGAQAAEQPPRLVGRQALLAPAVRQRVQHDLPVPVVDGLACLAFPHGIEQGEVVDAGEGVPLVFAGAVLGAVAGQDVGEDADRLPLPRPRLAPACGVLAA